MPRRKFGGEKQKPEPLAGPVVWKPAPTEQQVVAAVNERASSLPQGFVGRHPVSAAAVVVSPMPTIDLSKNVSVFDQGLTWAEGRTLLQGAPGALLPYYHQAFALDDPTNRARYLQFLDTVRLMSPENQALVQPALQMASWDIAHGGDLSEVDTRSFLEKSVGTAGKIIMAPIAIPAWAISKATDLGIEPGLRAVGLPGAADVVNAIQGGVGIGLEEAGTASTFVLRNTVQAGAVFAAEQFIGRQLEFGEHFQSWNSLKAGEHSVGARFYAELIGVDVDDPNLQGLFAFIDLEGDIGSAVALGAFGKLYMAAKSKTLVGGGTRTGSAWTETFAGKRQVGKITDVLKEAPEGKAAPYLVDQFPSMRPPMAAELARALPTRSEVGRVAAEYIDQVPERELPRVQADLNTVRSSITDFAGKALTAADRVKIQALKAKEVALEQTRRDLQVREVAFEFPKRSVVSTWMRRAKVGNDSAISRALQRQFGEAGRTDLSKWADDLSPKELNLWDRVSAGVPEFASTATVDALRKLMNIAKVPKALQRSVIAEYLSYTGKTGWYDFQGHFMDALEVGLRRGGKRTLTPEMQRLLRFSDNTWEERLKSPLEVEHVLPDGTRVTTTENVLQRPGGHPLPSRPSQVLGNRVRLPNPEGLRLASSFTRYWSGKVPGYLRMPFEVSRFAAGTLPRLLIRPLLLVGRAGMAIKIQLDQALRNIISGYKPLSWRRQNVDYAEGGVPVRPGVRDMATGRNLESLVDLPLGEGIELMGLIDSEILRQGEIVTSRMSTRGIEYMTGGDRYLIGRGVVDRIVDMSLDELTRKVVAYGDEGTLRYVMDHPNSRLGRQFEETMRPLLEEAGVTAQEWLQRTSLEIDQATGGNAALRESIATGKWEVGRDLATGEAIELGFKRSELETARQAALDNIDPAQQYVFNLRVEDLQQGVAFLERRTQRSNSVSLTNKDEMVNQVLNAQAEGRFTLPREVTVTRRALTTEVPTTWLEKARARAEKTNQFIYKGLRPLSSADALLTRGSTYRQVLEITRTRLIERGYSQETAMRIGQYHAALITKDLHYDISARSTVDRQLKDIFWFLPVVRENLYTYLVKMPRENFWPAGIIAEVGGAHALIQGLKDLGILRDRKFFNPDTGKEETELVMHVPWASDFIAGLLNDPTAGDMRVGGLNPAVAGQGIVPTVAPGVEAIFDMTAKRLPSSMQPFFEFLASQLEFDEDIDTFGGSIPSPIRYGLERLGITVPWDDLSPAAIAEAARKAGVQSVRWAAADLAKDGITPPGPGTPDDEVEAYRVQLEERAGHYRNTLNVIHLIGAVLLPGSITTTSSSSPAAKAYYKWRDTNAAYLASQEDYEANGDAWKAEQNEYLRTHPLAWAYAVGTKDYPDDFVYTDESYQQLPTLDPEDYVNKLLDRAEWVYDAPEVDPDTKEAWGALSDRQRARRTAALSTEDLTSLSPVELDVLGIPDFKGRDALMETLATIDKQFEQVDFTGLSDAERRSLYDQRDRLRSRAAERYGEEGSQVLALTDWDTTPAEILRQAGYLNSGVAGGVIARAADIWRDAIAKGYNPLYDSQYVVERKAELFAYIDRQRRADPEFDQEMRRLVLGVTDKTGALSNIDGYNQLLFGAGYGTTAIGREEPELKTKTTKQNEPVLFPGG